jgi:hypothetical protein
LNALNIQKHFVFMLSFEHVSFAIKGKYILKIFMTIQIILLHLWSFKHTKMQFEGMSIHLGDSFDCVFTQK